MTWIMSRYRAGDAVEVRSKDEIQTTVDDQGCRWPRCGRERDLHTMRWAMVNQENVVMRHPNNFSQSYVRGTPHSGLSESIRELWNYRELFYYFAWRDTKVRYKQTALGLLWAVIQPVVTMVIFTILFGNLANIPTDGVPYPIFYLSALVPWVYVSSTVVTTSMSLISNTDLMTKIYFPRTILPASVVLSGLVDFGVASVLVVGFMLYYGLPIGVNILLWPALVVPLALLSLSVGMMLAALNVKYRDVKYLVSFGIQIWLFSTPIIYPLSMVPERYQVLVALNPLSSVINGFRYSLVPSVPIDWVQLGISIVTIVIIFIVAVAFFNRSEKAFSDFV
jgi:lipopolysaccharide transport system permease protein